MNLPNKLTILRIILVPVFVIMTFRGMYQYSLLIFCLASVTDTLDGFIARRYNLITNFGKLMDPLADKILVIAAIVIFIDYDWCPSWILIIILAREFLVAGVRQVAASKGIVIAADIFGKFKTITQMIWIIIRLFCQAFLFVPSWLYQSNFVFMYISVTLTVISGFNYCIRNKEVFR